MSNNKDAMDAEEINGDLSNPDVVTKYKKAAEITNAVLKKLIAECTPGRSIMELCDLGDKAIVEGVKPVYNKRKIDKGIAFPTSIQKNNCLGPLSPLAEDDESLAAGDVVTIDIGAHIDGYCAVAAHTFICGQDASTPITGTNADVICAAHVAAEAALRVMSPGHKNTEVTEVIAKAAEAYGVNPVEGVLSHEMKRFVIDGNNTIVSKNVPGQKNDDFTFEPNQVYQLAIVMSTGDGKPREGSKRTTVYKRQVEVTYQLKMKAARQVLSEVDKRFTTFPFSLRHLEEQKSKFGLTEMAKHNLVSSYPVMYEDAGQIISHIKYTVLIMPSGVQKVTGEAVPLVQSDKSVPEDLQALLAQTLSNKKKRKKNKKKGGDGGDAMDTTA